MEERCKLFLRFLSLDATTQPSSIRGRAAQPYPGTKKRLRPLSANNYPLRQWEQTPPKAITPSVAIYLLVYGRSGLRPSLVQGLRPRNAPLQNHASPTVRLHRSVSAGEHGADCTPIASPGTRKVPRMTGESSTVARWLPLD